MTGWATWFVPIVVCLLFGFLFAYGPAIRAGKIAPAAALRIE